MPVGAAAMPWSVNDAPSLRLEFVQLALQEGANRRALCRRYGISPRTAYKWIARYQALADAGLTDRSRRPQHSPCRTGQALEQLVIALRAQHPAWGARKLHRRLLDLGHCPLPAPSTITDILHRHGLVSPHSSQCAGHWQRFEHAAPNLLWQIDFKGHFDTATARCHPLTLLDDHSRFNLVLAACARPNTATVQHVLTAVFERYGLPARINADNGSPWGSSSQPEHGITQLTVWLIRLGVRVSHSRAGHPQTNGKDERFHRSLQAEVLGGRTFAGLAQVQQALDAWRVVYNQQRPHEALGLATPISRYRPSQRQMPSCLPPIEYAPGDTVVQVRWDGRVDFAGRRLKVSNALHRQPIAFRPVAQVDGLYEVYFCHQRFMQCDLRALPSQP